MALALGYELMAGHSPSGFSGGERNSWFHQLISSIHSLTQKECPSRYYYMFDLAMFLCHVPFLTQPTDLYLHP